MPVKCKGQDNVTFTAPKDIKKKITETETAIVVLTPSRIICNVRVSQRHTLYSVILLSSFMGFGCHYTERNLLRVLHGNVLCGKCSKCAILKSPRFVQFRYENL